MGTFSYVMHLNYPRLTFYKISTLVAKIIPLKKSYDLFFYNRADFVGKIFKKNYIHLVKTIFVQICLLFLFSKGLVITAELPLQQIPAFDSLNLRLGSVALATVPSQSLALEGRFDLDFLGMYFIIIFSVFICKIDFCINQDQIADVY